MEPTSIAAIDFLNVFKILKKKSLEWDSIGRELGISFDFREQLRKEGATCTTENKLERVIAKWIESRCSEVSWQKIKEVLRELKFIDTLQEVSSFLKEK